MKFFKMTDNRNVLEKQLSCWLRKEKSDMFLRLFLLFYSLSAAEGGESEIRKLTATQGGRSISTDSGIEFETAFKQLSVEIMLLNICQGRKIELRKTWRFQG